MNFKDYLIQLNYIPAIWLIIINLAGFILCAVDKRKAIRNKWRIPERDIFIAALLGGSAGVYLSMLLFRHKTKHLKFMAGIPLIFIAETGLLIFLLSKI